MLLMPSLRPLASLWVVAAGGAASRLPLEVRDSESAGSKRHAQFQEDGEFLQYNLAKLLLLYRRIIELSSFIEL